MGAITAKEALAIGINWILAPIVDVNNNPDNPVINIRSFAETPEIVANLAQAFILGANSYPVLTTAKHFPGHGDTSNDSHLDLPIINHDHHRLEAIELPPFQAAIESGVDSIMSGQCCRHRSERGTGGGRYTVNATRSDRSDRSGV
jgi:beta-glucosidase